MSLIQTVATIGILCMAKLFQIDNTFFLVFLFSVISRLCSFMLILFRIVGLLTLKAEQLKYYVSLVQILSHITTILIEREIIIGRIQ